MNWDKIQKKYPKAWFSLKTWNYQILDSSFSTDHRLIYFFDEQGIYITIAFNNEFGQGEFIQYWWGEIDIKVEKDEYSGEYYDKSKTRTEAEEKAFEKAFEILENKLEGEK